jgi:penicillin-binding protein 1B
MDVLGNRVYLGDDRVGLADACRHYFNKPLPNLAPQELALLAALMRSPNALHPACHPERALAARNAMLERMEEAGLLDAEAVQAAMARPLHVVVGCRAERPLESVG